MRDNSEDQEQYAIGAAMRGRGWCKRLRRDRRSRLGAAGLNAPRRK